MVTYSVERAKTSRSKCKGICKGEKIAKDDFRWCSHPDPENAKYEGQVFNSHLGCVTANVFHKAIALYGSLEDIPGVVESDALDAIRKAVEDAENVRSFLPPTVPFVARFENLRRPLTAVFPLFPPGYSPRAPARQDPRGDQGGEGCSQGCREGG